MVWLGLAIEHNQEISGCAGDFATGGRTARTCYQLAVG